MVRLLKLFLVIVATLVVIPCQLIWLLIPGLKQKFWILPKLWHRILLWILGVKVTHTGNNVGHLSQSVIYTANHLSYLDINVMGGLIDGAFISKSDVAQWPVFGFLAKLQATLFIQRIPRHLREQKTDIEKALIRDINLVLFPEGTTTDGMYVLPFKSSLFSVAVEQNAIVQPVSIVYKTINGMPYTHANKDMIAWYINPETGEDADLAPHLWNWLKQRSAEVEVHFHPPLDPKDFKNRKHLALAAQESVSRYVLKHRLPEIQGKALENLKTAPK